MRQRAPEQVEALAEVLGTDPDGLRERIDELAGHRRLGEVGADRERIDEVVDVAMARPELQQMTPGEVERADLEGILAAAW
jgi:alcohol dehydrogenase class IV